MRVRIQCFMFQTVGTRMAARYCHRGGGCADTGDLNFSEKLPNPIECILPLKIAVTFEPILQCLNLLGLRMYKYRVSLCKNFSFLSLTLWSMRCFRDSGRRRSILKNKKCSIKNSPSYTGSSN